MLTPDQIKSKEFHTTGKSSYKAEEVDEFLEEIHASYDQMFRENGNIIKKMSILANKVEEYKKDEDSLRQALLSAQKLADKIVAEAKENSAKELSEAKEKAEKAVADANAQARKILDDAKAAADAKVHDANKQAEEIIGGINRKVTQENLVLEMLKKEVSAFRNKMMDMYKEHLTLLDRLPTYTEEKEEPVEEKEPEVQETAAVEQEAVETAEPVAEEPVEEAAEEVAEKAVEEPVEEPEEESAEEPKEDDGFELSDIANILDEEDVSEEDKDAFTLDETAFDDEPEDEFEDVSSDVSEDNGGFSLNIDELDFDDDDDDGITADAGDYASVDEEESDDDEDDGAISFKKFFKKK